MRLTGAENRADECLGRLVSVSANVVQGQHWGDVSPTFQVPDADHAIAGYLGRRLNETQSVSNDDRRWWTEVAQVHPSGYVDRGSNQRLQCLNKTEGNSAGLEYVVSGKPTYAENVQFGSVVWVVEWREIVEVQVSTCSPPNVPPLSCGRISKPRHHRW